MSEPLFLFSLPRSGSTLLQRMMAVHPDIATASELWFLLPFVYTLRKAGVVAQYSHVSLSGAMEDMLTALPNGSKDYYQALGGFAREIYEKLNVGGNRYFLDKTPRYYLIVEEIGRAFPDARFIFLFRNPLAVLASTIESFYRGRIGDPYHAIDIFRGPHDLAAGYEALRERSLALSFESLVCEPEREMRRVCDYLSIPFVEDMVAGFADVKLNGRMGDRIGTKAYDRVSGETVEKWRRTLNNVVRRAYARRYLRSLGRETTERLGYDLDELLAELNRVDVSYHGSIRDVYDLAVGWLIARSELRLLIAKRNADRGGFVHI